MPSPSYDSSLVLPTPNLSTALATGFHPYAIPDIVYAENRIYILWGEYEDNRVLNGSAVKVVSGTAPDTFSVSAVSPSASGETGLFYYTYQLYDPDDVVLTGPAAFLTSLQTPYPSVTLAAQDAQFSIPNPAAGSRFTRARVFRNVKFTVDMRQLTGVSGSTADVTLTPGGGGSVTFTDSFTVTDDVLRTRDPINIRKRFRSDGLPPRFTTGMFYEGRLYGAVDNIIYFSETAPNIEDFPVTNKITLLPGPEDRLPEIIALRVCNGQRYAYTKDGIYHIFGSSPPFGVRAVVMDKGAQGMDSTRFVDGVGVVFAGRDKPYIHFGGPEVRPLGIVKELPNQNPVEDLYQQYDAGRLKDSVALVDPYEGVFEIVYGTNGSPVNDRALLDQYLLPGGGAWSMNDGRVITRKGWWQDKIGRERPVFGDDLGNVWQDGIGNSEGVYGGTATGTVGAGPTLTSLPVTGLLSTVKAGVQIVLKNATTGAVIQTNRVRSYDGIALLPLYPFTTLPTQNEVVEIGSIFAAWESGWFTLSPSRVLVALHKILLYLVKQSAGTIRVLFNTNQNETLQVATPNLPLTNVQEEIPVRDAGAQMKVRFEETAPGTDFAITGFDVQVAPKGYWR